MPKSFLISRKRAGVQFEDSCLEEPPSKILGLVQSEREKSGSVPQESIPLPFSCLPIQVVYSPDGACELDNNRSESEKCLAQKGSGNELKKCHLESLFCRDDHDIFLSIPRASDENVKISKRCVKRSLSFNGNSSTRDERDANYVSIDINNNTSNVDTSGNHSRTENEFTVDAEVRIGVKSPYISNHCNTRNRLSQDESFNCINKMSGSHDIITSKETRQLEGQTSTVYLRSKSDSEDNRNTLLSGNGFVGFAPTSQDEQFDYDRNKIQNDLPSHTIEEPDTCQSMVQKRDTSKVTISAVATAPKPCASSPPNLQLSENPNLNNTPESMHLIPGIRSHDNSEIQREISIGLLDTTTASQNGHLENGARIQRYQKVPSCLRQSETTGCLVTNEHQCHQDESDTKMMTSVKISTLPSPSSPESPSSSSSSPSSVRSSSLLRPEPWANQTDLLPSAATPLSSSPSPSSPSTLKSTHSSHFLPKCPFPSSVGKFFFWDSPQTDSSSIDRIHSHDPSDTKSNSDIVISKDTRECHPLPSHMGEPSSISKSENDSKFVNIMKNSSPKNKSSASPNMFSTYHENSFECHDHSKKKKQKESQTLGKSFTIESIMKSENSKTTKEEISERRVEITSSFNSSVMAQGKSYLCDKSQNVRYLEENGESPQASTKHAINRQSGKVDSEAYEEESSTFGKAIKPSVTTRHRHLVHSILKSKSSSQLNQTAVENDMDKVIQRRNSVLGNTMISNPSSKTDSLGDVRDNETTHSSPESLSSTMIHKLHRPLPLIPRPTPVFPSVLPYSPFPSDLYPSVHLPHSPLRADVQSRSGISNLTINSNAPFAGKTLPLTTDPVFHNSIVDSDTLSRNPSIRLLSQNEKRALINSQNSMNTNCFGEREGPNPYNKPVYIPHEVLKYAPSERSNLGINQLHSSLYLATKGFEGDARHISSDPTANHEFYQMASYMNSTVPINKLPGDQSAMSQSQGRSSCDDDVEVQDDLQNSSCDAMSPLKALGITGSKSFKDFLESANVKLEFINKGHGIKNPLLNAEFGESKLDLLSHASHVPCPVCHIGFQSSRELQRHLKGHKEIKRFLCTFCGKGFNDTFDLKRHTRTHTGVRPYKCPKCDKAFTQRCSLESHCRKIHGVCPQLAFNQRRTKLYVCEDCGHATSTADEHFAHLRHTHAHTGEDKALS